MKSEITDIIYYINKKFYKGKILFLNKRLCNAEKQLPCNCLTGIILNYWAFAYYNCYKSNLEPSFRIYNKSEPFVLCSYNNNELLPVVPDESNTNNWNDYILNHFICEKEFVSNDQIYIIGIYDKFPKTGKLEDYEPEKKIAEAKPMFEFLSYYFPMTRTCSVEKECSMLLFMMLYLFPNKTLKLIYVYLVQDGSEEEKEYIKDYLNRYKSFITNVKGSPYGLIPRFSRYFQEFIGIPIAEFIEKVDKSLNNNFIEETIIAACNRNLEEFKRRSSPFIKIMELE